MNRLVTSVAILGTVALAALAGAQEDAPGTQPGNRKYSPYPEQTFPNRVFFGDTHLHTSYSTDAGMIGNTLGPEEAYRFARGETVTSSTGLPAKLPRPLDFLVVADHAEGLGVAPMIAESNPAILKDPLGKKLHDLVKAGKPDEAYDAWRSAKTAGTNTLMENKEMVGPAWQRITAAAEKFNEPGRFTAFIGFEWTADPNGANLHRNVIFRDSKEKADQVLPFSAADSLDPEKLWEWMAAYEKKTGGRLLAIPHNGNLSNGLMFDDVTLTTKKPIDREYAARRMRWEPLYEVTQMKGDNLDRVQVVKGWLDANGKTHERIWDVAVSDGRKIGSDGRCKESVGNTVNVEQATYTNAIGDAVLGGYWRDPEFNLTAGLLLRTRARDSDAPLDDLRRDFGRSRGGAGSRTARLGEVSLPRFGVGALRRVHAHGKLRADAPPEPRDESLDLPIRCPHHHRTRRLEDRQAHDIRGRAECLRLHRQQRHHRGR